MKRFFKGVMALKTAVCALYTGAMVIYLFFCLVFDNQEVSVSMLWTLLLACVLGALLQAVCFSDWIIRKMRYTLRSLSLLAWKADWFPVEQTGSWVTFIGSFFATFFVMTLGFDIYFRITGRKYDGLLGQYRREKEKRGE